MKVSQIMHQVTTSVSEDTPVKEVSRYIFSLGISGVPVVKGKKLVGMITREDILPKIFPSIQEFIEDYPHSLNFENIEKNIKDLLDIPVAEIMNRQPTTIAPDTPIMRALSIMLVHNFSRLPIVDENKNLLGIISEGDIFRQILRNEIPKLEKEKFVDFIAAYYDEMVNWEKRFAYELPVLFEVFKKERVSRIADIGSWTGEYPLELAKKGFRVTGLDNNPTMISLSNKKRERLSPALKKQVKFLLTDFADLRHEIRETFDAAICMGNALLYFSLSPKELFERLVKILRKNGILIIQLLNFEKIIKTKDRLLSFKIQKSHGTHEKEHLFLEFFDEEKENFLIHRIIIFENDGKNWIFKGIISIPIHRIKKDEIERLLRKMGFQILSISGNKGEYRGEYGPLSFSDPFKPLESDWLNILAKR